MKIPYYCVPSFCAEQKVFKFFLDGCSFNNFEIIVCGNIFRLISDVENLLGSSRDATINNGVTAVSLDTSLNSRTLIEYRNPRLQKAT